MLIEGVKAEPWSLNVELQDGKIDVALTNARLQVASVSDRPVGCLVDQLQLADTLQVQTRFESSVPIARLLEPDSWIASVVVDVRGLAIAGEPLSDFTTSCELAGGELNLATL